MKPGRLRAVRWTEMSIVFQGALHALNPVQRVGRPDRARRSSCTTRTLGRGAAARVGGAARAGRAPGTTRRGDYPHQLSGGQRQRVLIALALACEPRLLIADEPTTALDVMVQAQVLELLERAAARARRSRMIFITHDLSTLAYVCRRLGCHVRRPDRRGGPADEVFARPQHPYTRRSPRRSRSSATRAHRDESVRASAGDPPDPARSASRVPVPPALRGRARRSAPTTDVELWPAGDGRRAACIHVLEVHGDCRATRAARDARAPTSASARGAVTVARAVDGVDLDVAPGRGPRARRRVRLRQDDARPDDPGARAARAGRGRLRGRAAPLRRRVAARRTAARCRWSSRTRRAR